jgi:hypothetical protein
MTFRATITLPLIAAGVSSTKSEASVAVVTVSATDIRTDPDSKNRSLTETVLLSEVTVLATTKVFADSFSVADTSPWALEKAVADPITASDTFSRTVSYIRAFSDVFVLDDAALINKDFYGNKDNAFGVADDDTWALNKGINDPFAIGDTITYDHSKAFSDSMPVTDAPVIHFSTPLPTDYMSVTDASTQNLNKGVPDTLSFGDTFSRTVTWSRTFNDTFVLDDAALINKDYYGNKDNAFGVTDSNTWGFTKPLTDGFSVGDAVQLGASKNITTDTVSLTDSVQFGYSVGLTDSFAFTDPLAVDVSKVMAPDSMSMSDNISILHISASSRLNASSFNVATFNS